jgi:acyl-coenzyme A thioesterase PaaI-like protein
MHVHFGRAVDAEGVQARLTLAPEYQGWRGIAHGGIVMALLDEAMAHAAGFAGHRGVTASVSVRFRKPVPLEQPIEVRGRVTWQRRNVLGVDASVLNSSGDVLAHAEGSFVSRGKLDAADDRRNPLLQA